MYHCCGMDSVLLTHQYSTRPAGNMNIIPPDNSNITIMTLASLRSSSNGVMGKQSAGIYGTPS